MRVVGSTSMNKQSSRSHAIFTIFITIKSKDSKTGKNSIKSSEIHIVDLAGSERQSKTNATGSRLKEGSNINKSLTFLGVVIEKLSTSSSKKGSKEHIPYRNSQLTFLLSESLGGNSKTIMIAAVSPAAFNYDETMSTLAFADRAAAITNKTSANVNEETNLKAQLANELEQLKQQLKELEENEPNDDFVEEKGKRYKGNEDIIRYKAEIQEQQELIKQSESDREEQKRIRAEIEKTRKEKLADGGLSMDELREELKVDENSPYIMNISDDPTLSGWLVFYLKNGVSNIGSNKKKSDITIKGLGIFEEHWKIEVENYEKVKITPIEKVRTLVNGNILEKARSLKSSDRLVFGHGNSWKIIIPKLQSESTEPDTFDYGEIMNDRLNSDTPEAKNIK